MNAPGDDLPMAAVGCTLTESGLVDQLARYRQLGVTAKRITRHDLTLQV